jgi:hypothetical protein
MTTDIVRIYYYKNKILHNMYYGKADNEFVLFNETAKCIKFIIEYWKID